MLDAIAYDINVDNTMPHHEVKVIILPKNTNSTEGNDQILVDEVFDYLYQRMIPPTTLRVLLPANIDIDIEVTVKAINVDPGYIRYEVERVIREYFDSIASKIGEKFYPTDLAAVIRNMPNVNQISSLIATPTIIDETIHVSNVDKSITIPKFARAKLNKIQVNLE